MSELPFVSVIVPCRNEAAYLRRMLASVLSNDYPRDRMELLVVDGMSDDGTRAQLEELARAHPFLRVLDNPRRTVPVAMNLGIGQSRGDVIVRLDVHNEYPPDYIRRCVRLLCETGAGCAGGRIVPVPNGGRAWGRAVAAVTGHVVGVGRSAFRVGDRPGFVDTVPCGTFRREVFNRVGLYDERLTRNQDNELTARLRRHGYQVAFDPSIRILYWNQATLGGLSRQGFYNGMWNVYALRLHPYTWKPGRFIPAIFVLYLASLAAVIASVGAAQGALAAAAFLPLALYSLLVADIAATRGSVGGGALRVATTVVAYHFAYGFGTHLGLANLVTGRWRGQLGRPLKK